VRLNGYIVLSIYIYIYILLSSSPFFFFSSFFFLLFFSSFFFLLQDNHNEALHNIETFSYRFYAHIIQQPNIILSLRRNCLIQITRYFLFLDQVFLKHKDFENLNEKEKDYGSDFYYHYTYDFKHTYDYQKNTLTTIPVKEDDDEFDATAGSFARSKEEEEEKYILNIGGRRRGGRGGGEEEEGNENTIIISPIFYTQKMLGGLPRTSVVMCFPEMFTPNDLQLQDDQTRLFATLCDLIGEKGDGDVLEKERFLKTEAVLLERRSRKKKKERNKKKKKGDEEREEKEEEEEELLQKKEGEEDDDWRGGGEEEGSNLIFDGDERSIVLTDVNDSVNTKLCVYCIATLIRFCGIQSKEVTIQFLYNILDELVDRETEEQKIEKEQGLITITANTIIGEVVSGGGISLTPKKTETTTKKKEIQTPSPRKLVESYKTPTYPVVNKKKSWLDEELRVDDDINLNFRSSLSGLQPTVKKTVKGGSPSHIKEKQTTLSLSPSPPSSFRSLLLTNKRNSKSFLKGVSLVNEYELFINGALYDERFKEVFLSYERNQGFIIMAMMDVKYVEYCREKFERLPEYKEGKIDLLNYANCFYNLHPDFILDESKWTPDNNDSNINNKKKRTSSQQQGQQQQGQKSLVLYAPSHNTRSFLLLWAYLVLGVYIKRDNKDDNVFSSWCLELESLFYRSPLLSFRFLLLLQKQMDGVRKRKFLECESYLDENSYVSWLFTHDSLFYYYLYECENDFQKRAFLRIITCCFISLKRFIEEDFLFLESTLSLQSVYDQSGLTSSSASSPTTTSAFSPASPEAFSPVFDKTSSTRSSGLYSPSSSFSSSSFPTISAFHSFTRVIFDLLVSLLSLFNVDEPLIESLGNIFETSSANRKKPTNKTVITKKVSNETAVITSASKNGDHLLNHYYQLLPVCYLLRDISLISDVYSTLLAIGGFYKRIEFLFYQFSLDTVDHKEDKEGEKIWKNKEKELVNYILCALVACYSNAIVGFSTNKLHVGVALSDSLSLSNSFVSELRPGLIQFTPSTNIKKRLINFIRICRRERNTESPRIVSTLFCSLSLAYPFIIDDLLQELQRELYPPYRVDDNDLTEHKTPLVLENAKDLVVADNFIWYYTLFLDLCSTEFPSLERTATNFSQTSDEVASQHLSGSKGKETTGWFYFDDPSSAFSSSVLNTSQRGPFVPSPSKLSSGSSSSPSKYSQTGFSDPFSPSRYTQAGSEEGKKDIIIYNEAYKAAVVNFSNTFSKKKQILNNLLVFLIQKIRTNGGRLSTHVNFNDKNPSSLLTGTTKGIEYNEFDLHRLCCCILYPLSVYASFSPFLSDYVCEGGIKYFLSLAYLSPLPTTRELVGRLIRAALMKKENIHEKKMIRNMTKKKEGKKKYFQRIDAFDRVCVEVIGEGGNVCNIINQTNDVYESYNKTFYYSPISSICLIPSLSPSNLLYGTKEKDVRFDIGKPFISTENIMFSILGSPLIRLSPHYNFSLQKEKYSTVRTQQLAAVTILNHLSSLLSSSLNYSPDKKLQSKQTINVPFQLEEPARFDALRKVEELMFIKHEDDLKDKIKKQEGNEEEEEEEEEKDDNDDEDNGEEESSDNNEKKLNFVGILYIYMYICIIYVFICVCIIFSFFYFIYVCRRGTRRF
jgi:hypothetical protein